MNTQKYSVEELIEMLGAAITEQIKANPDAVFTSLREMGCYSWLYNSDEQQDNGLTVRLMGKNLHIEASVDYELDTIGGMPATKYLHKRALELMDAEVEAEK